MLSRRKVTGVPIPLEQFSHKTQANVKPIRDLPLRAFVVLIGVNDTGSNVFRIGPHYSACLQCDNRPHDHGTTFNFENMQQEPIGWITPKALSFIQNLKVPTTLTLVIAPYHHKSHLRQSPWFHCVCDTLTSVCRGTVLST